MYFHDIFEQKQYSVFSRLDPGSQLNNVSHKKAKWTSLICSNCLSNNDDKAIVVSGKNRHKLATMPRAGPTITSYL